MKLNPQIALRNEKGFTLIELIVSMTLIVLVALMAYGFLGTTGNFFKMNSDKADAQDQSRLIFQGMKIELSAAKKVTISDYVKLENPGEIGYYVQGNQFYREEYPHDETVAFGNLPVPGLTVEYVPATTNSMRMIVSANNEVQFETEIFSENIKDGYETGMTSGAAIVIEF